MNMTSNGPRPTILCVDDEPGILRSIKRSLKHEQLEVLTASSAAEALEIFGGREIALVLSDYRMPDMNGVELLEQVTHRSPETFRIILTGYAEAQILIEAVNRGHVSKIIYKPFQEEDIQSTVRSAVEHYAETRRHRALGEQLAHKTEGADT
jgi:DNA-binding NtrC family response regulator